MEIGKRITGLFKPKNKKTGKRKPLRSDNKKIEVYNGGKSVSGFSEEKSRYPGDFGRGFYTSVCSRHASDFVLKFAKEHDGRGMLSEYSFNLEEAKSKGFRVKVFDEADKEWFIFICNNRAVKGYEHDYDIVIGPTADYDVRNACLMYMAELIDLNTALANSVKGKYPDQVFFHNKEAFDLLTLTGAEIYDGEFHRVQI